MLCRLGANFKPGCLSPFTILQEKEKRRESAYSMPDEGRYFAGSAAGDGRIGGVIAAGLWALASGDLALQANQPNTRVFLSIELVQRKLPAVF